MLERQILIAGEELFCHDCQPIAFFIGFDNFTNESQPATSLFGMMSISLRLVSRHSNARHDICRWLSLS